MGILVDSWCFCNGGGKSERMKASMFSTKGPAMAHIAASGTGFLIHRNLLLTTHLILPCFAAAEAAEIQLQNGVASSLFPNRSCPLSFFNSFSSFSYCSVVTVIVVLFLKMKTLSLSICL